MKFVHPRSIYIYSFEWNWNGRLTVNGTYCKQTEYKGKQLAFGFRGDPNVSLIPSPTVHVKRFVDCASDPFIYVCPEVSTARDSFRNSSYRIVRDKEKATCIVVPRIKATMPLRYNIAVVTKENDVYLFSYSGNGTYTAKKEEVDGVMKQVIGRRIVGRTDDDDDNGNIVGPEDEIIKADDLSERTAFIINACDEYPCMYSEDPDARYINYCFEDTPRLIPITQIGPDLFAVWGKCTDSDIIASAVLQCNWWEYPFTLASFLREHFPYIHGKTNKSLQHILHEIGYHQLREKNNVEKLISPEDWNMYQKCKLYELGLSENGGFLPPERDVSGLLPHTICVTPMYIDAPASFATLKNLAKV